MNQPPDLDVALAELGEEMGDYRVKLAARPANPGGLGRGRWKRLCDWCLAHPNVGVTLDNVPGNRPYKMRIECPRLTVSSWGHKTVPGTGRRVASMHVIYEPKDDA